jgi:hypothetical protein
MKIIKQANQSVLDLLLQGTGNLNGVVQFLRANAISMADEIPVGMSFIIPKDIEITQDIVSYYSRKGIKPATGFVSLNASSLPPYYYNTNIDGIGEDLLDLVAPYNMNIRELTFHLAGSGDDDDFVLPVFTLAASLNQGDNITLNENLIFRVYTVIDGTTNFLLETNTNNSFNSIIENNNIKIMIVALTLASKLRISAVDEAGNESILSNPFNVNYIMNGNFSEPIENDVVPFWSLNRANVISNASGKHLYFLNGNSSAIQIVNTLTNSQYKLNFKINRVFDWTDNTINVQAIDVNSETVLASLSIEIDFNVWTQKELIFTSISSVVRFEFTKGIESAGHNIYNVTLNKIDD